MPLTGFGNTLARGVREAVAAEGLTGALSGALASASSGITAAIICGFLAAVLAKPKEK